MGSYRRALCFGKVGIRGLEEEEGFEAVITGLDVEEGIEAVIREPDVEEGFEA